MNKHIIYILILLIVIIITNGCSNKCISFEDEHIKMYMLQHHDKDGDKCISDVEASYVTEIQANAFDVREQGRKLSDMSESKQLPCPSSLNDLNKFRNLTKIGKEAFYYCLKLESVKLDYVESVGEYAFKMCGNVKEIVMPKLNKIGNGAFITKSDLERVEFTTTYEIKTGEYVFYGCPKLLILNANQNSSVNEGKYPWIDKTKCNDIRYIK